MKYLLSVAVVVACTSMAALTAPSLAQTAPGAPAAASGTPTAPPYMPNVLLGPAPVPFPPPVSIKDQGSYLPDQYAEYYIAGAPAWNAFIDTDLGIQDWWVHSVNHEVSAGVAQDRTYDFEYLKPRYAFAHIVAGNDAGEAGVWHGGLKTRGH